MAITFKSVGHFFATFFQKVEGVVTKVEGTQATVDAAESAIPVYGPLALSVTNAAYAVLGEVAAALNAGGEAAAAGLANAGLDKDVVTTVQAVLASAPQVATLAKTLVTAAK